MWPSSCKPPVGKPTTKWLPVFLHLQTNLPASCLIPWCPLLTSLAMLMTVLVTDPLISPPSPTPVPMEITDEMVCFSLKHLHIKKTPHLLPFILQEKKKGPKCLKLTNLIPLFNPYSVYKRNKKKIIGRSLMPTIYPPPYRLDWLEGLPRQHTCILEPRCYQNYARPFTLHCTASLTLIKYLWCASLC